MVPFKDTTLLYFFDYFYSAFFLKTSALINSTMEKIRGENTITNVAMLTFAAKATGNIPNPAFDGASRSVPNATMYKVTNTTETDKEMIERGK